jgi:ABC-type cobalamin/Fe3+-siderophores transport system ATPase subunit
VLLLGTAGTGKTTTLQAANRILESSGLAGRIVRAAYTGVASSNMGTAGGVLQPLRADLLGWSYGS